jgi:lipoate-protein ligase A
MSDENKLPKAETHSRSGVSRAIRLVNVTFDTPEENLAYDEVLLDQAEKDGREVLRFWEGSSHFVVLGVSQVLREEVNERECEEDGVPVLRRCSAGGCVLQGPGCLNFTLVLTHERHPDVATIRGSYCYILGRICEFLQEHGIAAKHKGTSDIAVKGRKISGNAQKRRRKSILHHGTLLYGMDGKLMERYLKEPSDRPQYRGARTHSGFVKSLPLAPEELREMIVAGFGITSKPSKPTRTERKAIRELVEEKYGTPGWIQRR